MDVGVLDSILAQVASVTTGSMSSLTGMAKSLFGILIVIDLILAVLLNLGETDNVKLIIRKVLAYGFWIWIITNWGMLINVLVDSLSEAGSAVGGVSAGVLMHPSQLIDRGLYIAKPYYIYAQSQNFTQIMAAPLNWLMAILGYCGIILAFGIMALQVFITYVEFYISSALLLIFIPWGSLKYTSFMAEKAMGAVISYGTKLMVLGALYGLSSSIFNSMSVSLSSEPDPASVLGAMVAPFALSLLSWQAPAMAAGLMTGAPSLTAGTAIGGAMAGAAGVAAGMGAASGLASGAAAGAGSATRAAASAFGAAAAGASGIGPDTSPAAGAAKGLGNLAVSAASGAFQNATSGVKSAFAAGSEVSGGSSSSDSNVSGLGGSSGASQYDGFSKASSSNASGSSNSNTTSSGTSTTGTNNNTGSSSGSNASGFAGTGSTNNSGSSSSNNSNKVGYQSAHGNTVDSQATASSGSGYNSSFKDALNKSQEAIQPDETPQGGFEVPLPKDDY